MNEPTERFLELLPGGFTQITDGGTRNQIKLLPNSLEIPEGTVCPIETKPQEEISVAGVPKGWRILTNPQTPHLKHLLVVPPVCWPRNDLQNLGGGRIMEALNAISLTIANYGVETSCFAHIGRAGGQNLRHHHWHAMQVLVRKPLELEDFTEAMKPERIVCQNESFTTFAGGARGGECLIVPIRKIDFRESIEKIGDAILRIVNLGNEKFSNPDFMVTVRVSSNGTIRYADYCPVLNFWGSPEYITAPLEGGPITIPHTHELTAETLRG